MDLLTYDGDNHPLEMKNIYNSCSVDDLTTNFRFHIDIVLAVYNEGPWLSETIELISNRMSEFDYRIILSHNGPDQSTLAQCESLSSSDPKIDTIHSNNPGIGYAYSTAINDIVSETNTSYDSWTILWAADLPFKFSDFDKFLDAIKTQKNLYHCYVGSKSHPSSICKRTIHRTVMSGILRILTKSILNLRTRDPQGSLFIRSSVLTKIHSLIQSRNFLYSIECVYLLERFGYSICEVPIVYLGEKRVSTVRPFQDSWSILKGLIGLRITSMFANKFPRSKKQDQIS